MSRFKVGDKLMWSNEPVRVKAATDGAGCLVRGEGWAIPMWVKDDSLRYPNQEPPYSTGGVLKGTGDTVPVHIEQGYVIPAAATKKAGLDVLKALADKTAAKKQLVDYPIHDAVNHPTHYVSHPSGVECIQVTEHMGFCLGNALKYIWRADLKNDAIEDLRKAIWYIEREIALREQNAENNQQTKEN